MAVDDEPEEDSEEEDSAPKERDHEPPSAAGWPIAGLRVPVGFAQSLMSAQTAAARIVDTFHAGMKPRVPDVSASLKEAFGAANKQLSAPFASTIGSSVAVAAGFTTPMELVLKQVATQRSALLESLRDSLRPMLDPELFRGFNRSLLPPNLKDDADQIRAEEVHQFLEQEGIPLYLVPRGRTALRLIRGGDRSARRRVLGDCYQSIMDDCVVVLESAAGTLAEEEAGFALDASETMCAGHPKSAQAMLTVVLDTLISRFYPDKTVRKEITNRTKGAAVPGVIDEMAFRESLVWLPVWNAHEQFWKHKGDEVPRSYSRHASVHGVSRRQFSKRNCTQVLMLVTSLIGYAVQLEQEVRVAHTGTG